MPHYTIDYVDSSFQPYFAHYAPRNQIKLTTFKGSLRETFFTKNFG